MVTKSYEIIMNIASIFLDKAVIAGSTDAYSLIRKIVQKFVGG